MYSDGSNQVEASGWHGIKTNIKAGDYLMIQFGTNDSSGIAGRAVTPPTSRPFSAPWSKLWLPNRPRPSW